LAADDIILGYLNTGEWLSVNGVIENFIRTYGTKNCPTRGEVAHILNKNCDEIRKRNAIADTSLVTESGNLHHSSGGHRVYWTEYRRRIE